MRSTQTHLMALALVLGAMIALGPDAEEREGRQADLAELSTLGDHERPVLEPVEAAAAPGVLVVDLIDGATAADLATLSSVIGAELAWVHPLAVDEALASAPVANLAAAVAALSGHPLVEYAEPELAMEAFGFPDDPMYEAQWNLRAMGADAGWEHTPKGAGVIVAVIDTGVTQVEDLAGTEVLEGASFVPGVETGRDDHGHGTHVAGTIAQTTNNGVGVAGVAPGARILPVKVLSAFGGGTSAGVAAGIDYAVDEGAQVINLSLGGPYSLVVHNAVKKAHAAGVIVVAAAGNNGRGVVSYPGGLAETLGVSATGPSGALAPYSNWGKGVDLAAPGGDKRQAGGGILQDTVEGEGHAYKEYQGTSMATPHVAGAAAVLLSTGFLDGPQTEHVLKSGADGVLWNPRTGYGRLDLSGSIAVLGGMDGTSRFGFGALIAFIISGLAGSGLRFRAVATLAGGIAAGGVVALSGVPGVLPQLLSRGVLAWPVVLVGPVWAQFPLWVSALVPLAATFVLGAFKLPRPVALGITAGVGTHLVYGILSGGLFPWWVPASLTTPWLGVNAAVCLVLALALVGIERRGMTAAKES